MDDNLLVNGVYSKKQLQSPKGTSTEYVTALVMGILMYESCFSEDHSLFIMGFARFSFQLPLRKDRTGFLVASELMFHVQTALCIRDFHTCSVKLIDNVETCASA